MSRQTQALHRIGSAPRGVSFCRALLAATCRAPSLVTAVVAART
jgi:hypothetical protein